MRISSTLLLGSSLLALAAPAYAQTSEEDAAQAVNEQIEPTTVPTQIEEGEIIVTATKRAGRVQDVPFSINAQTQADLQRANAQTLEDISRKRAQASVRGAQMRPTFHHGRRWK